MLKVALEMMLFAALFALMVFAPQVVIGRPQGSITQDTAEQLAAGDLGFLSTSHNALLGPIIEGAGGTPAA